ncbi:MAG: hypothetical protein WKG06_33125 [Segetibacter sp.]
MKEVNFIAKKDPKLRKRTEGRLKKGILMPEKLALANKLLAGVKLPNEPEAR